MKQRLLAALITGEVALSLTVCRGGFTSSAVSGRPEKERAAGGGAGGGSLSTHARAHPG